MKTTLISLSLSLFERPLLAILLALFALVFGNARAGDVTLYGSGGSPYFLPDIPNNTSTFLTAGADIDTYANWSQSGNTGLVLDLDSDQGAFTVSSISDGWDTLFEVDSPTGDTWLRGNLTVAGSIFNSFESGLTAPAYILSSTYNSAALRISEPFDDSNESMAITFYDVSESVAGPSIAAISDSNWGQDLVFYAKPNTGENSTIVEQFRLLDDGNVTFHDVGTSATISLDPHNQELVFYNGANTRSYPTNRVVLK